MLDDGVLTTGRVAEVCRVSARTVSKWFDLGLLPGYRIPCSRERRIPIRSLFTFMQQYGIPTDRLLAARGGESPPHT